MESDSVAVGTSTPVAKFEVVGDVRTDGNLIVTGAFTGTIGSNNGAPFPRPAYNSGWVHLAPGETKGLTHNLGGNVNDYVVDLQFKDTNTVDTRGIHHNRYGGAAVGSNPYGGRYTNLDNQIVHVYRFSGDPYVDQVRIRIWVIK